MKTRITITVSDRGQPVDVAEVSEALQRIGVVVLGVNLDEAAE